VIGGFGRFEGQPVCVIGQEKGSNTETRLRHNFGMAKPEGYRKAVRLMELADRFGLPVLCFVDTAGAFPGIEAEERGQAEAIARSTEACLALGSPNVSLVIGEGGSGGAVAIATANRVLMLEHAVYSVISPEGAASILWRDAARAQDAATGMKITAQDLLRFGVIDRIISSRPAARTVCRMRRSRAPAMPWRLRSANWPGSRRSSCATSAPTSSSRSAAN
jgi:acetyl-CoA carboxylase carboxyl transferase subunit alpha